MSSKRARGGGAGFLGLVEGERLAERNDEEGFVNKAVVGGNKKPNKAVTDLACESPTNR